MGKIFNNKFRNIALSYISLLVIFSFFQNCQKVHFGALVDPNAFNDKPSSALFCSSENEFQIRVPRTSFDSQSVCTDSYNLISTAQLGKVCEAGPEVFAIPETSLEYNNCRDMTICGVKYESILTKNESYLLTFKNLPIGCSAQVNIYKDESKTEQLFTKLFNVPIPTCPVCNYTNIPTCGVCEDPIISACGYNQDISFANLSEVTTPCLSGSLGEAPVFNSTTQKVEWNCKGSGTNLSNCSYDLKPGACEIKLANQNINYDGAASFSVSFSGSVTEASKQSPMLNCMDASGTPLNFSTTSTATEIQWELSHLTSDTSCTATITDILNNNISCSNSVFVGPAPVAAVCGNQSNVDRIDDLNNRALCAVGTASTPAESVGTQRYTWSCNGLNGGANTSCFAALNPPICNIILNPGTINLDDTVNYQFNLSGGYDSSSTKPNNFSCHAGSFTYTQSNKQTLGSFVVDSTADSLKLHCDLSVEGYLQGSTGTCSTEIDILPRLAILKSGNGNGVISATGIDCGTDCSESFVSGTEITLTATPAAGSIFEGWNNSDCTTSTTTTCTVTVTAMKSVSAVFTQTYQLSVAKSGTGSGAVTATGIDCGATCTNTYNSGTSVTLTVTPAAGSVFAGWNTGDCTTSTATTCTFLMTATKSVAVIFNQTYQLSVTKAGTGSGLVTATGIDCGATCTNTYNSGTSVTLTAIPSAGSVFAGWNTGDCTTSTATTCTFTMTAIKSVSVVFTQTSQLSVAKSGTGSGTATATGIDCGATCTNTYNSGTSVTLTATPAAGSIFEGWNIGDCTTSTATTCTFTMTATKSVAIVFNQTYQLSVAKSGTGSGTVTATGIDCGATCNNTYNSGTSVTLTVTPAAGSAFAGWNTGDCTTSTATTCTFTMTATKSVAIVFNQTYQLSVAKAGTGSGLVTAIGGISCGATCNASYNSGSSVTLTAMPNSGFNFDHWEGDCTGTATTCTVSMSSAKSVIAWFINPATYALTISKTGTASAGKVTATGIDCGTDCAELVLADTLVTLTAIPVTGATFGAWSSNCIADTPTTCVVTMSAAKSVTASFGYMSYDLTVAKNGVTTGTVSATGLTCPTGGSTCTGTYTYGSSVTLTATVPAGTTFDGWNAGDCTSTTTTPTNTCTFTMTAARIVTASFSTTPIHALSVNVIKTGTGNGSVSGSGLSYVSGTTYSGSYYQGTSVTLTATVVSGSIFDGWSGGGCSGTATTCVVSMSQAQSVSATFRPVYKLIIMFSAQIASVSGYRGTVTATGTTLNCYTSGPTSSSPYYPTSGTGVCEVTFSSPTTITLTATPIGTNNRGYFSWYTPWGTTYQNFCASSMAVNQPNCTNEVNGVMYAIAHFGPIQ